MDDLKKLVSIKYGIDLTNDIEILKVKLPFCCEIDGCKNLKYGGGLFTQCGKESDEDFCKVCKSEINRGGSKYGTTYDRKKYNLGEFVSNTGKVEIDYVKYMKQHGYSRDMVIDAAKLREIELPANIFDKKKTLKNLDKSINRSVIVDDTESEKDSVEEIQQPVKRGRGRPRKDAKQIINEEDIDTKKETPNNSTKKSTLKPSNEVKNTTNSNIKLDKQSSSESINMSNIELEKEIELADSDSDSDDEIEVRKFDFKGITYLKDIHNNKIYTGDGDHIGVYNDETNEIEFE